MNLRHTLRLLLVAACAALPISRAHADYEQWQYWATASPSTIFSNEGDAVAYMQSLHPSNAYRTARGPITYMSRDYIRQAWYAPNTDAIYVNDWTYSIPGTYLSGSAEAGVVAAFLAEIEDANEPCAIIDFDVETGWDTETYYLTLPTRQWKTITWHEEIPWYNPNTQLYECMEPSETPFTMDMMRNRTAQCPQYYYKNNQVGACVMDGYEYTDRKPIAPCSGEEVGNPCDVASGAKIIRELDYAGPGLELTRTFNSQSEGDWNHNFSQYFIPEGNWANGLMTAAGYVTVVRRRSLSYS